MSPVVPGHAARELDDHVKALDCSAHKTAYPNGSAVDAFKCAKIAEQTARRDAMSVNQYHEFIQAAISTLSESVSESHEEHQLEEQAFPDLSVGTRQIGRYKDVLHYKDGLSSEVFKASEPSSIDGNSNAISVALKVTTPSANAPPHDPVKEAHILKEAKSPHVVPLLDTFQQAGGSFIMVFPFLSYDLDTLLHRKQLDDTSRKSILKDLLSGLAHLHTLGIIHRDLKPSNILLSTPRGPAYIADFGIAWSASDSASESPTDKITDVGTTCYRPPELLFGHRAYGTQLDMWAAGCVAAQVLCLNGKTMFDAGDLGSELALIKSIFETLGTPDLVLWPEAATFPDWGKMNFRQYPARRWEDILPGADSKAVDLVKKLVVFESADRMTAKEALQHHYFT